MRRRLRSALMRLPGGVGYRMAGALHLRRPPTPEPAPGTAPADLTTHENGSETGPLSVEVERDGRRKRLRVRTAGDIWSDDFRAELARDRRFEASLAWREAAILLLIAAVLVLRSVAG